VTLETKRLVGVHNGRNSECRTNGAVKKECRPFPVSAEVSMLFVLMVMLAAALATIVLCMKVLLLFMAPFSVLRKLW
jgi:hypothetical protein